MNERDRSFLENVDRRLDPIGQESRRAQTVRIQDFRRRLIGHLFILSLVLLGIIEERSGVLSNKPDFTIPTREQQYRPPADNPQIYQSRLPLISSLPKP